MTFIMMTCLKNSFTLCKCGRQAVVAAAAAAAAALAAIKSSNIRNRNCSGISGRKRQKGVKLIARVRKDEIITGRLYQLRPRSQFEQYSKRTVHNNDQYSIL